MSMFRKRRNGGDPTSYGAILLQREYLTQEQLDNAIEAQSKGKNALLGDVCIALGYITSEQRDDALWAHRVSRGKVSKSERVDRAIDLDVRRAAKVLEDNREIQQLAVGLLSTMK